MDYGDILGRTWNIIWANKFLILLGLLVALSSGIGSGSSSGFNYSFDRDADQPQFGEPGGFDQPQVPIWLIIFLGLIVLAIALVVWAISTIARGGLIAGAAAADAGLTSSLGQAWGAGWRRGWTLLGIGVVPALPGLVLLLLALLGIGGYAVTTGQLFGMPRATVAAVLGAVACLAVPFAIVLDLLRTFANRACMLEDLGVVDSYRRGLGVLGDNLGSALVLFLIQIALTIIMAILLFLPGALLALCCLFWPILLLFQGAVTAYFSTMWTLAWRRWTGKAPVAEEPAAGEPAAA